MVQINNTRQSLKKTAAHLSLAASLCPTFIQTCVFAYDGVPPTLMAQQAYLEFLADLIGQGVQLKGVLLYGIARSSQQPEATQLSTLSQSWMEEFAHKIEQIGLSVQITP